ncbi:MAG: hypothetical protein K1060chlam4_01677, partial [Candidatus Anoxychlamydiales bacterium]|nr:hypothetical protein [Candidatus Anoxychlamydiales bacterium]
FRVGFGAYAMHDAWNIQADWTYIKIKSDSEVSNGGTGNLLPLYYPPTDSTIVMNNASARWSGDYSTMDIMMGKPYHVSRYYTSNPMFGVRLGFIDQDLHIRYFAGGGGSTAPILERNGWLKNDYWGAGLRGLYEGQFLLGSGFSFYGKIAFAILFGKFDLSQQQENALFNSGVSHVLEYKTEDSFYSVQPNAEIGMGFSWNRYFHQNQYQVSVKVGYEFHHWWDQNQARKFFDTDPTANDTVSRGDLSFNGFMFGLHLEF